MLIVNRKVAISTIVCFVILISACSNGLTAKQYSKRLNKICSEAQSNVEVSDADSLEGQDLVDYWVKIADVQSVKTRAIEDLNPSPEIQETTSKLNENNKKLVQLTTAYVDALLEVKGNLDFLDVDGLKYLLLEMQNVNLDNQTIFEKLNAKNCY